MPTRANSGTVPDAGPRRTAWFFRRAEADVAAGRGYRRLKGAPPGVAAVGLHDLAFGVYVRALALFSTRRAVGVVLGMTVLIPLGDVLVLLAARGSASPRHLLLHLASAGIIAAAVACLLRRA